MDNADSARGAISVQTPAALGYGLAEYGAPWADCDRVLVTVHGRDRTSEELFTSFVPHPISGVTHILAPYANSKSWYEGRYDAPRSLNAAAVHAGLAQIGAAFERAAEKGFPASKIVLAGFSQGGCMVVEYLLSGAQLPAAAAIFTGSALEIAQRREALPQLDGMPIVLSGGSDDPWLPTADLEATGELLKTAGAVVHFQKFPDGDHVVRTEEISLLGQLVERVAA